jgi:hypothetical protein
MTIDDHCDGSCIDFSGIQLITHEQIEKALNYALRPDNFRLKLRDVPDYILYKIGLKKLEDTSYYNRC